MKSHFIGLAIAALLVAGTILPGHAEDAAAPKDSVTPAATQTEAPSQSVPRPSLAPKAAEPASPETTAEPAPSSQRWYAHRHTHRWGTYRTAYWEPFPIYWPHLYHHRIHWNRMPWVFHF